MARVDNQLEEILGLLNEVGDWFTKTYRKEASIEFKENLPRERFEFNIVIQTSDVSHKEMGIFVRYTDLYDLLTMARIKKNLKNNLITAIKQAMPHAPS